MEGRSSKTLGREDGVQTEGEVFGVEVRKGTSTVGVEVLGWVCLGHSFRRTETRTGPSVLDGVPDRG